MWLVYLFLFIEKLHSANYPSNTNWLTVVTTLRSTLWAVHNSAQRA